MGKRKKIILSIGLFIIGVIVGFFIANIPRIRYDLDNDGKITVKDMIVLRNYYLEH